MNASLLLFIATLALAIGPMLDRLGKRVPVLASAVDGATVGAIVTVACLHLMPEAGAHLGWWALALFAVGVFVPQYTERLTAQSWQGWRVLVGVGIVVLFIAHSLAEGAALASTATDERVALATLFAVASHNLPVGAVLWGQTKRRFGPLWSAAVIALVGAITWFGPVVIDVNEGVFSGVCSALLAGGLVHLVVQHGEAPRTSMSARQSNLWAGLGALCAAAAIVAHVALSPEPLAHRHGQEDLPSRFYALFLETAPPLLVGVIGAGLIEAFLPEAAVRVLARGSRLRQALSGVAVGAPMPVCSCGVLPIYRTLIAKGVPVAAALALLVAAPEIGVDSFLLSWNQLGAPATIARVLAALLLALCVGWWVGRLVPSAPVAAQAASPRGPRASVWQAVQRGLFETWGHLSPWILIGVYATVLVEPWISTDWARRLTPLVQILALSLLGMPTYICAAAATPFAALLLAKGFAPGAVIAFLLIGPATNLTTVGALARLHSRRVAVSFVVTAFATTTVLAVAVDLLLPRLVSGAGAVAHVETFGPVHVASAWILLALSAWVVLRSGPRGFLAQLRGESAVHEHVHGDDECAAHDHGEEGHAGCAPGHTH